MKTSDGFSHHLNEGRNPEGRRTGGDNQGGVSDANNVFKRTRARFDSLEVGVHESAGGLSSSQASQCLAATGSGMLQFAQTQPARPPYQCPHHKKRSMRDYLDHCTGTPATRRERIPPPLSTCPFRGPEEHPIGKGVRKSYFDQSSFSRGRAPRPQQGDDSTSTRRCRHAQSPASPHIIVDILIVLVPVTGGTAVVQGAGARV